MTDSPRPRDELAIVELDGEAVIYDESTGGLHHLNPTATIVWSLCDGVSTTSAIAADIADAFGLPIEEISGQVTEVVETFASAGLLAEG